MARSSVWLQSALAALALLLPIGMVQANEKLDPAVLAYKLPGQIQWRDPLGTSGVNQAILHGDPTKPGLYVVLNRFKPGNFSRPAFPSQRPLHHRGEGNVVDRHRQQVRSG